MLKDVVSAVYKGGYKIEVTFEDGVTGIPDFSKYLNQGGVFEKFKDIEFFKNFSINKELGVLTWGMTKWILPRKHFMLKLRMPLCQIG